MGEEMTYDLAYAESDVHEAGHNGHLNALLIMLGLLKHDISILGDCQTLAICLSYFGPKRRDERDRIRDVIKLKGLTVNNHHTHSDYRDLLEKFRNWRNNLIGDYLHSSLHMSDLTIEMTCNMLNKKLCFLRTDEGKGCSRRTMISK